MEVKKVGRNHCDVGGRVGRSLLLEAKLEIFELSRTMKSSEVFETGLGKS
jgi:hypothetical protein